MRDPLDKENFLCGNRQRWAVIFILCGAIVLFVNIFIGVEFEPSPYMQFLIAIGSLFILGASGDSWLKTYSAKSIKETVVKEETKRIDKASKVDTSSPTKEEVEEFQIKHQDDPSYAPIEWTEKQEVEQ